LSRVVGVATRLHLRRVKNLRRPGSVEGWRDPPEHEESEVVGGPGCEQTVDISSRRVQRVRVGNAAHCHGGVVFARIGVIEAEIASRAVVLANYDDDR